MEQSKNIQNSCGGQGCTVKRYNLPREQYTPAGATGRIMPTPSHIKTRLTKKSVIGSKVTVKEAA